MKAYRMKHLPTGLYLRPSTEVKIKLDNGATGFVKTNLSKVGKLYARRPTLAWLGESYYNHDLTRRHMNTIGVRSVYDGKRCMMFPVIADEWQIEEVQA